MARKTTQQRFIEERARILAIVYLTRRDDLGIAEEAGKKDFGVDLWVTLKGGGTEAFRRFGVVLKGVWGAVTPEQGNQALRPGLKQLLRSGPFPFPVVLFFYTMEDNGAWYTWVAEPVVTSEGDFEIVRHGEASCLPLDGEALDAIVEAVDRWYDAFVARATRVAAPKKRTRSIAE